jgi:WD40 repeat protein
MTLIHRIALVIALGCLATPAWADAYRRDADFGFLRGGCFGITFMPDGKRVVAGVFRDGVYVVQVRELGTNKVVKEFEGHDNGVWCVAVSADGKWIASGAEDNTARIGDYESGKEIAKIEEFVARVTSVAFSPDNKTLLVYSNDKTALLYDIAARKVKFPLNDHTESVRGVAFAPDGKTCATVGKDKKALIWNVENGKLIRGLVFPDIFYSVVFTPDSKKLIFAGGGEFRGDHSIKMVDLTEKRGKALVFKGHTDSVWALSLTRDGKTLASRGYHDCTARIWNVATQTSIAVLEYRTEVHSVAISSDGTWVATATSNGYMFWKKVAK